MVSKVSVKQTLYVGKNVLNVRITSVWLMKCWSEALVAKQLPVRCLKMYWSLQREQRILNIIECWFSKRKTFWIWENDDNIYWLISKHKKRSLFFLRKQYTIANVNTPLGKLQQVLLIWLMPWFRKIL